VQGKGNFNTFTFSYYLLKMSESSAKMSDEKCAHCARSLRSDRLSLGFLIRDALGQMFNLYIVYVFVKTWKRGWIVTFVLSLLSMILSLVIIGICAGIVGFTLSKL